MLSSSITNSAKMPPQSVGNDNSEDVQRGFATEDSKGKAASSAIGKPDFSDDNRYSARPLEGATGRVRAARLTRSDAMLNNDSLQRTLPEQSGPSLQRMNAGRNNPALLKAMEEIRKENRANPIPDTPEKVPPRLREKVDSIDLAKLETLDEALHKYAKEVVKLALDGNSPGISVMMKDAELLPLFAKSENSRNPDLNLLSFSSKGACYDAIRSANTEVQRSGEPKSMLIVYPPFFEGNPHHVAAHVQLQPGISPSFVALESAGGMSVPDGLRIALDKDLPDMNTKMEVLATQNSERDCVMFSISNALKAHKHPDYLSQLHNGESPTIPADFLKHTHSRERMESSSKANDFVTKDKTGPHKETLEHRHHAYRTQRPGRVWALG